MLLLGVILLPGIVGLIIYGIFTRNPRHGLMACAIGLALALVALGCSALLWVLSLVNGGPPSDGTNPFAICVVIATAADGAALIGIVRQTTIAVRRSKAPATRSSPRI